MMQDDEMRTAERNCTILGGEAVIYGSSLGANKFKSCDRTYADLHTQRHAREGKMLRIHLSMTLKNRNEQKSIHQRPMIGILNHSALVIIRDNVDIKHY